MVNVTTDKVQRSETRGPILDMSRSAAVRNQPATCLLAVNGGQKMCGKCCCTTPASQKWRRVQVYKLGLKLRLIKSINQLLSRRPFRGPHGEGVAKS